MHLVWKRPDGFHKANPNDFMVVDIDSHSRIWLHKKDCENYPFRVSGGWEDEEGTQRINQLANLLAQPEKNWEKTLETNFANSKQETYIAFLQHLDLWLDKLQVCAKGDTWEIEIITRVLQELKARLGIKK